MTVSEFDRVVLEAVSEDYESFESVVSKLSRLNSALFGISEVDRIERSLLSSIANKLVTAYLIHAEPPYATAVGEPLDSVRSYWFYLTEEGKEHLNRLLEKKAISHQPTLCQIRAAKSAGC